jgi:NADH-quinone oxidoreductase subunit L
MTPTTLLAALIAAMIGLPWLGAVAVWAVGDRRPAAQHTLAALFTAAAGLAALAALPFARAEAVIRLPMGAFFGELTFIPDGLGLFLAAVATIIGCLAVVFSRDYMRGEAQLGRYYFLILFFIGAMAGLVLTGSWLFLFVFWEITALTSYGLISFYNDAPKAVAGGVKALLITQVGGVGLLVAAGLAYGYLGTYDIPTFLARSGSLPSGVLATLAFACLIAAAAKSAQVPFHTWLPDAMEAPTPVSALIHAATMVNAGVYLLARFYPSFAPVPGWTLAVVSVGAVTALLAALMATVANDLKRVLAYSTVSQLGYMVYAIGVGDVFASQFHLLSHAVFKALLFLAAGAVIHAVGTRDLRQMGGLGTRMPFVRSVFVIGALALAGIPIFNGFWSKELVLEAGLHAGPQWAYLVMLFGAGLTAYYTARMVWLVFYAPPAADHAHLHPTGAAMRAALAPLAAGVLLTWLLAGPFESLLAATLPAHHLEAEGLWTRLLEVITAPATLLALAVIAVGAAAWWRYPHLASLRKWLGGFSQWAQAGFGFDSLNDLVVRLTQASGAALQPLQTGQVNWNLAGMVGGLLLVLAWLAMAY